MNKNLRALADAQKARRLAQQNKSQAPSVAGGTSAILPKPAASAVADTAPAVPVLPSPVRVIDAGGLISESVALKMQQDAAGIPPAAYSIKGDAMEIENAESQATNTVVPVAEAFNPTRFNHIYVNMAFTLNLGDPRLADTKASLSAVPIKGAEYNLYSPFRKSAGGKREDDNACPGIVRAVLDSALDVTDVVNNSRIVFLGDKALVAETLASSIETTRRSIEGMLPSKPAHVLFDVTDDEVEPPTVIDSIKLSDVVAVTSWTNTPKDPLSQIVPNNAIMNFIVNAGALHDTPDKLKYITQVQSVLNLLVKHRGESSNTNIVLALALPAMLLSSYEIRDLIGSMLEEHNFVLYSRMELENLDDDDSGFLPQCIDDVSKLLPHQCDLLLMKLITDDAKPEAEAAAQ